MRLSVCTWNVWGHEAAWQSRLGRLCDALGVLLPDVLLLQEVVPEQLEALDRFLLQYGLKRVLGGMEEGWCSESAIYYSLALFQRVHSFGLEDLKMVGDYHKNRGLFWARLQTHEGLHVFVSTAHLPWVGSEEECSTGVNQRIAPCQLINSHLQRLVMIEEDALVVFCGDLNEDFHPPRIIAGPGNPLGLTELFQALDCAPPITHPVRPSSVQEEARPDRTIDWLFFRARAGRPLCAMAKTIRGGHPPPSDHLPVLAVFEIS